MTINKAVKILKRRQTHLEKRINAGYGSESGLLFDKQEKYALDATIEYLEKTMALETNSDTEN